ncbi:polysaccharide deacetylase family protein [Domibacillus indicus]|uniref:polysaccharide deacetylase family protein n=1 Tax=Domibacillus indicus TaxID=1437523 RepID=UPI001E6471EB|nr:polysaccharide deacetylase family protein [Domibacillus indicus]
MPWLFIRIKQLKWAMLFLFSATFFLMTIPPPSEQPAVSFVDEPAAVYKGDKHVALTVNMKGSEKNTARLINFFIKHKVNASFFVTSAWLKKHPKTAKLLADRAFDIGVLLTDISDEKAIEKEIVSVQNILASHRKDKILYVRAEEDTEEVPKISASHGYLTVQWSVDLAKSPPSEFVRHVEKGDIVLLNPKEDLRITEKWLSLLLKKEKVVSLSEMTGGETEIEYVP